MEVHLVYRFRIALMYVCLDIIALKDLSLLKRLCVEMRHDSVQEIVPVRSMLLWDGIQQVCIIYLYWREL